MSEPIPAAARPNATEAAAPDEDSAGGEFGVVDVGRCGGDRVDPQAGEGELGQVGLAEADQSGPAGGCEDRRVALGHTALKECGARFSGNAGAVDENPSS